LIEKIETNKEIVSDYYKTLIYTLRAKAKQKLNKFVEAIPDLDAAIIFTSKEGGVAQTEAL
jgi:predicted solute-binding protein